MLKPLNWVLFDFDNTLAVSVYPVRGIGEPIVPNIELMKSVQSKGKKVFVFTARHYEDHDMIKKWLKEQGLKVEGIICGKPLGYLVDDRAYNPDCKNCLDSFKILN